MKKFIFLVIVGLFFVSALSRASELSDQVIVYAAYPNNGISYIYVISADGKKGKDPDTRTKIAYLKPPVFMDQTFVSRYYRNILCAKYSICN